MAAKIADGAPSVVTADSAVVTHIWVRENVSA